MDSIVVIWEQNRVDVETVVLVCTVCTGFVEFTNCMSGYSWSKISQDRLLLLCGKSVSISFSWFTAFVCLSMLTSHGRLTLNGLDSQLAELFSACSICPVMNTQTASKSSDPLSECRSCWLFCHYYIWFPRLQCTFSFLFPSNLEVTACVQYTHLYGLTFSTAKFRFIVSALLT